MAGETVLVIDAEGTGGHETGSSDAARALGLTVRVCPGGDALVPCLQAAAASGDAFAAVVLGPALPNPVAAARQVYRLAPLVQMVFVADAERAAQLRREMGLAPRIGTCWSIADPAALGRSLQEAVRSTQQRRQMRTTLDRLRVQVAARPADSADYRKLIVSDRFLASVLAHAQDAIFSTDAAGTILTWNHAAARLFGRAEADAVGQPIALLDPDPDAPLMSGLVRAVCEGEPEVRREIRLRRADDSPLDAEVTLAPVRDVAGQLLAVSTIARDVSERRRAEEAVRQQREWLRVTLTSIGDAVIATDTQGRVAFMNAVAEELTGWDQAQAAGRPLDEVFVIVNEQTRQPAESPVTKVLREGKVVGLANHTALIARDGTERPIDDSAAPMRTACGELAGVVLVFRDVTERRRAEAAQAERARLAALRADVSAALASADPSQAALQRCCEALVRDLDVAFARVWTLDASGGVLELRASAGLYTHLNGSHSRAKVGEFKIGRIAASRLPHLTNDVPHDPQVSDPEWARREGVIAFAGYPLLVDDRLVGVLAMFAHRPLTEAILADLAPLAGWIAQYIDRRRAEEEVAYQRQLLQTITDNAPSMLLLMDVQGRGTFANPAVERATGYQAEELLGQVLHEKIHHSHPDGTPYPISECPLDRALPLAQPVRGHEDVFVRKDGSFFPVRCSARPIFRDGTPVGTVIEVQDITEEKRAEKRVYDLLVAEQQRAARLAQVAQASLNVHAALSLDSVLRVITEEARRILNAHQAVSSLTVDRNWAQAVNAVSLSDKYARWRGYDAPPDGSGIYALVCRTNKPMRLTQEALEAHPAWRGFGAEREQHPPLRGWLAAPFVARDGRNLGLIQLSDKADGGDFTGEDEAILVQLATIASVAIENARLYEELREADRRKDEFLATLAHELRNPLAPIRNALQILRVTGDSPQAFTQTREMMERQVGHMTHLIDDLLDVSRITRNKLELRKDRVGLASVVQSAVESSRPLIEASGHRLTVRLPPEPIHLHADSTRLAQVFQNLLNNAAKYTERGGQIWLTAELASRGREPPEVVVQVRDTGIGIAREKLPRLFEMFYQTDDALERSQGGLGIGLTLVKRLVEMHGGSVEAHSEGRGKGSEFVVRLPVLAEVAAPPQPEPPPAPPSQAGARYRILVVDDNRDAADSLTLLLGLTGHEVRTAYDGEQAVTAAAAFRPDLILLDIGLPRLNGYETARHIRAQPGGQRPVLVALTGWGQEEDKRRSREAGFDHHLTKPVDPGDLQRLLAGLGSRERASSEG